MGMRNHVTLSHRPPLTPTAPNCPRLPRTAPHRPKVDNGSRYTDTDLQQQLLHTLVTCIAAFNDMHYRLLAYGCTVQQYVQVLLSSCVATIFHMVAHARMCMQHASA